MPDIRYGLIGRTLKHSFSKNYFAKKFEKEKIDGVKYDLFELNDISEVDRIFQMDNLKGFNITIPYKEDIFPYLTDIDESAKKIGAVNVVKMMDNGSKIGYNSDYFGFKTSLKKWADLSKINRALILGTGGASKAIKVALLDLGIKVRLVSRSKEKGDLTYEKINTDEEILMSNQLIVNCSPLGTYPDVTAKPDIKYDWLTASHYLYDLVYNPEETAFMKEGEKQGANVKNGLEMLILQAEKSWEIWNS